MNGGLADPARSKLKRLAMAWKGRYKLATQIGSHGFFAEVESAEVSTDPPVKVIFAELGRPTPGIDWRGGTTFGILYAVSKLSDNLVAKGLVVKVTDVHGMVADTGYMELAMAAAFAVWKALGHLPANPPRLEPTTKAFIFPK